MAKCDRFVESHRAIHVLSVIRWAVIGLPVLVASVLCQKFLLVLLDAIYLILHVQTSRGHLPIPCHKS